MKAIDTNVLVRSLTSDDPGQAARAMTAIATDRVFVATTVLLESEWVLRSLYGLSKPAVIAALRGFSGLPQVTLERPRLVAEALARADQGMDFADALHLGAAAECEAMLTFDRKFIKSAVGGSVPVREP